MKFEVYVLHNSEWILYSPYSTRVCSEKVAEKQSIRYGRAKVVLYDSDGEKDGEVEYVQGKLLKNERTKKR